MVASSVIASAGILSGACAGLAWIGQLARLRRVGRKFPKLDGSAEAGSRSGDPAESGDPGDPDPPRLAVIVAVRNEAANLEACVRSLLAQDYPRFEVWVVNDRSTDETPAILERLRRELDGRLHVHTVASLPDGWGGQSHALWQGVRASSGEWLCFTDADCRFDSESTLSLAWREVRAHGSELLSILPRMEAPTVWEKLYLPLCSVMLLTRLDIGDVNDAARPAAYANGAFMLMARRAYERLGGHERVRGFVNDDVRLSQIAKREGVRLRVVSGGDLVRTRMYASICGAWSGWTRNFYGTLQRASSLGRALALALGLFVLPWLLFGFAAAAAVRGEPGWGAVALAWGIPVVLSHVGMWQLYRTCDVHPGWSLLYLPGALFVAAVLANSTLRSLRRAGTLWHGVRYAHPHGRSDGP